MDDDAVAVVDESELAKAVHEEADARAGGTDHLGERLLGDGGDHGDGLAGLAEVGHEEEGSGQAFFAGVEELVDEIGLGTHAAVKEEVHEEVGERMLLMEDANHGVAVDHESGAGGDGGGGGQAQTTGGGYGVLAHEVAHGEERDGGLFADPGEDGEFGATGLKIEDGVGLATLRKKCGPRLKMNKFAANPLGSEKGLPREVWIACADYWNCASSSRAF